MGYNNGYYDGYEDGLRDARKKGGNAPAPEPEPMLVGYVKLECFGFSPNAETDADQVPYADRGCNTISELYLPYLKKVPTSRFYLQYSLEKVDMPAAESVEQGAFQYCSVLGEVNLPKCKKVGDRAFQDAGTGIPCAAMHVLNLPECEELGYSSFSGASLPYTVDFPECKKVGQQAFACLYGMVGALNLPKCTEIGEQAFTGVGPVTLDLSSMNIATVTGRACYWGLNSAYVKCSDGYVNISG